jgi:hypothetical protein
MSDSHNPELEVVTKCTSDLETALYVLDRELVHFLRNKGFLPSNAHDDILAPQSMMTDVQRAGELVKCIRNRVKQESADFYILLNYFKRHGPFYEPVVKKLTAAATAAGLPLPPPSSSPDNERKDAGEFEYECLTPSKVSLVLWNCVWPVRLADTLALQLLATRLTCQVF